MKRMVVQIGLNALGELLQVPVGARIVRVDQPIDRGGVIMVAVEGAGVEVEPGELAPIGSLTIRSSRALVIDWPGQ